MPSSKAPRTHASSNGARWLPSRIVVSIKRFLSWHVSCESSSKRPQRSRRERLECFSRRAVEDHGGCAARSTATAGLAQRQTERTFGRDISRSSDICRARWKRGSACGISFWNWTPKTGTSASGVSGKAAEGKVRSAPWGLDHQVAFKPSTSYGKSAMTLTFSLGYAYPGGR